MKKQIVAENNRVQMASDMSFDPQFILKQIDEIFVGIRKSCSSIVMLKGNNKLTNEILKYVFEDYLQMNPFEVRDRLTPEIVKLLKLKPFIQKRIPCPAELNANKELQYVAWYLYPHTRNTTSEQLTIKVYTQILAGQKKKYPKYFFDELQGENRAKLLLKTMINEFICPNNVEELYAIFADVKNAAALLTKYGLKMPLNCIFITPLEYLHESLGKQGDEYLYNLYKKRAENEVLDESGGVLESDFYAQDNNYAVEIVLSDIPDIPDYDCNEINNAEVVENGE